MTIEPTDEDIHAAIDAAGVFWSAQPVREAITGDKPSDIARSIWAHARTIAKLRNLMVASEALRDEAVAIVRDHQARHGGIMAESLNKIEAVTRAVQMGRMG